MKTTPKQEPLSYSRVNTYMTCPLKFRFAYVDREKPDFTTSALVFGSAMHSSIQAFLQSCLEGDPLRNDQLVDVYRDHWKMNADQQVRFSAKETEESLLTKAASLLDLFVEQYDHETEIVAVEEPFTININPLTGSDTILPEFTGFIDAIVKNGSTTLVDFKTTSKKPHGDVNAIQLAAYSMATGVFGYEPEELEYRYDYLVKTAKPEFIRYPITITENHRTRFLKTVMEVWKGIERGIFFPNPTYLCSSCGFRNRCDEW